MKDWSARADGWLDRDHALLTDATGFRQTVDRDGLTLGRRTMPDDPNDLFRWRIATVNATAEAVFDAFVHRILENHRVWTKEFVDGRVVEQLAPHARVIYQRFDPGLPGISKRDLCSIEVLRDLGPGVKLASFRSVDRLPPEPGYARIDWWGAALCTTHANGRDSELVYLDRENQGGRLPAWFVNLTMTRYLTVQAEAVRGFFAKG